MDVILLLLLIGARCDLDRLAETNVPPQRYTVVMEMSKTATSTRHALSRRAAKKSEQEIWLEENREAMEAYNELVAKEGVFSDGLRGF